MMLTITNKQSNDMWVTFDGENDLTITSGASLTLRDDYENGQVTIYSDHIETHQILRPQ